jgi:Na+/proline symporter
MRVLRLGRTIAWVAIVAALLLALTGPHIPGWLLSIAIGGAFALGVPASVKQKRLEREAVRRLWQQRRRITSGAARP